MELREEERAALCLWMTNERLSQERAAQKLGIAKVSLNQWLHGGGIRPAQHAKLLEQIKPYMPLPIDGLGIGAGIVAGTASAPGVSSEHWKSPPDRLSQLEKRISELESLIEPIRRRSMFEAILAPITPLVRIDTSDNRIDVGRDGYTRGEKRFDTRAQAELEFKRLKVLENQGATELELLKELNGRRDNRTYRDFEAPLQMAAGGGIPNSPTLARTAILDGESMEPLFHHGEEVDISRFREPIILGQEGYMDFDYIKRLLNGHRFFFCQLGEDGLTVKGIELTPPNERGHWLLTLVAENKHWGEEFGYQNGRRALRFGEKLQIYGTVKKRLI